jgi:Tfp pilus assembly protein PilF
MSAALDRALVINPNLVEALTFRAGLALEASEYGEATADIERAFKINPRSLDAHAIRAAMLYLQDRDFEPEVAAALRINPRYGTVFNVLSHFATIVCQTGDRSLAPTLVSPSQSGHGFAATGPNGGRTRGGRKGFRGRSL